MDAIVLTTLSVALLTSLIFIFKIWPRKTTTKIPEPAGGLPIVGHLHLLSAQLHRSLASFSDRYGPIFQLRLGKNRVLVVSSIELAKECLTTHDRAFSSRPPMLAAKILGYDYAMFGMSPYNSYWREMRKIATLELFSNRQMTLLQDARLEEVRFLLKDLFNECRKEEPVSIHPRLKRMTLNIMLRKIAGKRYAGGEDEERQMDELLKEVGYRFAVFTASDVFPWLRWIDAGHIKAMNILFKKLDAFAERWLSEHLKRRDSGGSIHDFIDVLLSQLEDGHLSYAYDLDTIVKATALTLAMVGSVTTTDTLAWALGLLLNHPDELKKVQDELDFHIGRDRLVDESDLDKLPYLQAVVKETLRLYPPVPTLSPHHAIEPVNVAGYHVPAGTSLFVNVWKIQRDPRIWSQPDEFKPARFLTSHREVSVNGKGFELFPFGSGRRSCPAANLALQVVNLALASLLHGYEWRNALDGPVDMSEGGEMGLAMATPLQVRLRPRMSAHLYD